MQWNEDLTHRKTSDKNGCTSSDPMHEFTHYWELTHCILHNFKFHMYIFSIFQIQKHNLPANFAPKNSFTFYLCTHDVVLKINFCGVVASKALALYSTVDTVMLVIHLEEDNLCFPMHLHTRSRLNWAYPTCKSQTRTGSCNYIRPWTYVVFQGLLPVTVFF